MKDSQAVMDKTDVEYFNAQEVEDFVKGMIKNDNPEWVDEDGSCSECDVYYDDLETAVIIEKIDDQKQP